MRQILAAIAWIKNAWDWGTFVDALLSAAQTMLGMATVTSLLAMIYGAWADATGYQVILAGLLVFVAMHVFFILRAIKKPKPAFALLYDETNPEERYWSWEQWPPEIQTGNPQPDRKNDSSGVSHHRRNRRRLASVQHVLQPSSGTNRG